MFDVHLGSGVLGHGVTAAIESFTRRRNRRVLLHFCFGSLKIILVFAVTVDWQLKCFRLNGNGNLTLRVTESLVTAKHMHMLL